MKKSLYLLPIGIFFLCTSVSAQQANDATRKVNVDSLQLVSQISQDQVKLGKLQNLVDQKTKNKTGAAVDAQNSASENAIAAQKLNADPDNKKLASNANSAAGDAKSDARKSRKESARLDDLYKSIKELKSKIAVEQAKLSVYSGAVVATPVPTPLPAQPDTTTHP